MMINSKQSTGGVLIVAGHAIWHAGHFHGGFPGEQLFYGGHVEAGVRLLNEYGYEYLVLSGGKTRPKLEKETGGASEAEGMKAYALHMGLISPDDDRIILENFARDTFENLFFSMLAFHLKTGKWPERVGFVSWNSKGLRVHLIAAGLLLGGRIFFYGVGDYPTQIDLERACAAEARFNAALVDPTDAPPAYKLVDPLLRNEVEFAKKRWDRMPVKFTANVAGNKAYIEQVKMVYGADEQTVREVIERVESLKPGDGWRHIGWPWL